MFNRSKRLQGDKSFKELNLYDNFLFSEVMLDEEVCKAAIEIILGRKVERIVFHNKEQQIDIDSLHKGIRLDVWFQDDKDTIYNLEMQATNRGNIPRRSRHYQGMVDVKAMPKGERDYNKMPDVIIIFICLFDLFGEGRYCYTFSGRCDESSAITIGDGANRIFLNTKGTNDSETSEELIEFLKYIEHTNEIEPKCKPVQTISRRVKDLKEDAEVEEKYMTTLEWRDEILEQGRELGREEGREQERKEGIAYLIGTLKELKLSNKEIEAKVCEKYKMSKLEFEQHFEKL